MANDIPGPDQELVPGRSCDGCTMCCKLLEIDVLDKPRGVWCPDCNQKKGCTIYDERPSVCRNFYCGYLRISHLDERWKPSKSKFLINFEWEAKRVAIHVDPARPDAWREEPFYSEIKRWAKKSGRDGTVVVWAGDRVTVVMANKEKDLGSVRPDQLILPVQIRTSHGVELDFELVDPDDPRLRASDA